MTAVDGEDVSEPDAFARLAASLRYERQWLRRSSIKKRIEALPRRERTLLHERTRSERERREADVDFARRAYRESGDPITNRLSELLESVGCAPDEDGWRTLATFLAFQYDPQLRPPLPTAPKGERSDAEDLFEQDLTAESARRAGEAENELRDCGRAAKAFNQGRAPDDYAKARSIKKRRERRAKKGLTGRAFNAILREVYGADCNMLMNAISREEEPRLQSAWAILPPSTIVESFLQRRFSLVSKLALKLATLHRLDGETTGQSARDLHETVARALSQLERRSARKRRRAKLARKRLARKAMLPHDRLTDRLKIRSAVRARLDREFHAARARDQADAETVVEREAAERERVTKSLQASEANRMTLKLFRDQVRLNTK